jgi:CheY-like chemotaxis protein
LIVDDEPDTRELLAHRFTQCGAQVRLAASADEALAMFKAWNPAILVSDIGMPGGDGYRLIRDIRSWESEHGGCIPAVALTAYARREDQRRALTAGFQMHVSKPVEPTELVALVMKLVLQNTNSN